MEKPRTRIELANELGLSARTLHRKLRASGYELPKGLIMPLDQVKIIDLLGFNFESLFEKPNLLKANVKIRQNK